MGRIFKEAGYDTGFFGKWHMPFREANKNEHGFDTYIRKEGRYSGMPCSQFIRKDRKRPFLAVASFINPHNICEWSRGQKLPGGPIDEPPKPQDCPPLKPNMAPPEGETDIFSHMRKAYQAHRLFPVGDFTNDKWRQYRWAYYRLTEKVDRHVRTLLDALREMGQQKNTLVVFLSDHGECHGVHHWNQKTVFYDEAARVPFVISQKGTTPQGTCDALVHTGVDLNVRLSWTPGFGAKLHYIIFGEDFDDVNNTAMGSPQGTINYSPGTLKLAKTYYWRIDEFGAEGIYKGEVWSFTTKGAVSGPNPANGAVEVSPTQVLTWIAGAVASSHEVYFGTDADVVKNATKSSPEYKGPKALGEESYDPGKLMLNTAYYWRIDEVNGTNPDSPWAGNVWSFTTGDFFVIDDFEAYNTDDNQIWFAWHDGLGAGVPGVNPYVPGNGTGAAVGDETTASYTEETIVHGGGQSMPYSYDNNKQGFARYSEAELTLSDVRDWTAEGVVELSLWFRGNPASVGSFVEGPTGTYTITATGTDIWNEADQFHYAFKTLNGTGSIIAKVESVQNTNEWAKAGVMIRETLDAGSKFAGVYITPGSICSFQGRLDTDVAAVSDSAVRTTEQQAIVAPYWVKLERDFAGNFRASYSANGSNWTLMSWNPQNISMSANVYVGLALTSHNDAATYQAVFSNVTITGNAGQQWANQDVGIESNDAEALYVAISNSTGAPAVVVHDDPAAVNIDTWTEWIIPLSAFANQGINLANVDKIAIGFGTKGNTTIPGGKGKMYFDDIRLYRSR